jgi:hypothetical protein
MKLTLSFISIFSVSFSDLDLVMFNKATRGLMVLPWNTYRWILIPHIKKHAMGWGAVLEIKLPGSNRLEERGINHDMNPLSLPNDSLTHLNAELNDKQPTKRTYLRGMMLTPQKSGNKQAIRTSCLTLASLKECQGGAPTLKKAPGRHPGSTTVLYTEKSCNSW